MSKASSKPSTGLDLRAQAKSRVGKWVRRKYHLESVLGVGGMASVYAATHRNGARLALKVLHTEFAADESLRDRFLREGYVANKVDHPGRVAILDDDETEAGEAFLVMELLEGQTLQQRWKRAGGKVEPVESLSVMAAVLDTLVPFHEKTIVHRDLKPANIFITNDGVVKLLDFGVAQLREAGTEKTRAGTAMGTPSYMAPEQAMGKSDSIDGRADLYSVGATLYAVMSGRRLYHGKSDNEAFILAATQPAPSLARTAPDLPVQVIALVDKALQWDRRSRYQSAAAMRDAAHEIIAELEGTADSEPPAANIDLAVEGDFAGAARGVPAATVQVQRSLEPPPGRAVDAGDTAVEELFKQLDRLVPPLLEHGAESGEVRAGLQATHKALLDALRADSEQLEWKVFPYCFTRQDETVWEPAPPADVVPHNLAAAGVEKIRIRVGVTEEELLTFCQIMLMDGQRSTGDLAGALWEARLEHVQCVMREDFAGTDAAEQERFFVEAESLEATASKDLARVAAWALADELGSGRGAEGSKALDLDPAAIAALGTQISAHPERYQERFLDTLADAMNDATQRGDADLVTTPLTTRAEAFAREQRLGELFAMHAELLGRLAHGPQAATTAAHVTTGMFPTDTVREIVRLAASPDTLPNHKKDLLSGLERVLLGKGPQFVGDALGIANETSLGGAEAVDLLLGFVERAAAGHEAQLVERLDLLRPALAQRVLAFVCKKRTKATAALLRPLLSSGNPVLRCEVIAQLAGSSKRLGKELVTLLQDSDEAVRAAALGTMQRHKVRGAGAALLQMVEDKSFTKRSSKEQRLILETLYALNAERAEQTLIAIVEQHGLMADDSVDRTRTLAASLLGERATSDAALEALTGATRRRWWNSASLREVAVTAANAVAKRQSEGSGASRRRGS